MSWAALMMLWAAEGTPTAGEPPPGEPTPLTQPEESPTPPPADPQGTKPQDDPVDLYEWGIRAKDLGLCSSAEAAWSRLVEDFPTHENAAPALYMQGICREKGDDTRGALGFYQQVVEKYPTDPLVKDATFRMGLVLEWQGHYREAELLYEDLLTRKDLSKTDQLAIQIQRDIERVKQGKERQGGKSLLNTLDTLHAGDRALEEDMAYWMAKAELSLGEILSRHARTIPLQVTGVDRLRVILPGITAEDILAERLEKRTADLLAARGRYQAVFDYRQIEWNLAAIYAIGQDYELLYQDLLDAPLPRSLDNEEQEVYREALVERVRPIKVQAFRTYWRGYQLSRDFDTTSYWARQLEARVQDLERQGFADYEEETHP